MVRCPSRWRAALVQCSTSLGESNLRWVINRRRHAGALEIFLRNFQLACRGNLEEGLRTDSPRERRGVRVEKKKKFSELVAHFFLFGLEVAGVVGVCDGADGELLDDLQVVGLEADDFAGVVREKADFVDAEVGEDLSSKAVVAEIHGESKAFVGFDGVEPLLLQFVGADFWSEADATAFLAHVEQDTGSFFFDALHGLVKLGSAVAAAGGEDIAGEAFAVNPHQCWLSGADLAFNESDVVHAINEGAVEMEVEIPVVGGHVNRLFMLHELLAFAAVSDEVLDGTHFEPVFLFEADEIRQAGHGAIVLHDFANDSGGIESGEARKIDGGLGVTSTAKNPAGLGLERENMPGLDEIGGLCLGIREQADRGGTVFHADACGYAFGGIHRNGEIGFKKFAVLGNHSLEAEAGSALLGDGRADETSAELCHEIDGCRRDLGGGHDEIALVLAVGVVGDNHHASSTDVGNDFWNRIEWCFHVWNR
jgi:hypothetical protein